MKSSTHPAQMRNLEAEHRALEQKVEGIPGAMASLKNDVRREIDDKMKASTQVAVKIANDTTNSVGALLKSKSEGWAAVQNRLDSLQSPQPVPEVSMEAFNELKEKVEQLTAALSRRKTVQSQEAAEVAELKSEIEDLRNHIRLQDRNMALMRQDLEKGEIKVSNFERDADRQLAVWNSEVTEVNDRINNLTAELFGTENSGKRGAIPELDKRSKRLLEKVQALEKGVDAPSNKSTNPLTISAAIQTEIRKELEDLRAVVEHTQLDYEPALKEFSSLTSTVAAQGQQISAFDAVIKTMPSTQKLDSLEAYLGTTLGSIRVLEERFDNLTTAKLYRGIIDQVRESVHSEPEIATALAMKERVVKIEERAVKTEEQVVKVEARMGATENAVDSTLRQAADFDSRLIKIGTNVHKIDKGLIENQGGILKTHSNLREVNDRLVKNENALVSVHGRLIENEKSVKEADQRCEKNQEGIQSLGRSQRNLESRLDVEREGDDTRHKQLADLVESIMDADYRSNPLLSNIRSGQASNPSRPISVTSNTLSTTISPRVRANRLDELDSSLARARSRPNPSIHNDSVVREATTPSASLQASRPKAVQRKSSQKVESSSSGSKAKARNTSRLDSGRHKPIIEDSDDEDHQADQNDDDPIIVNVVNLRTQSSATSTKVNSTQIDSKPIIARSSSSSSKPNSPTGKKSDFLTGKKLRRPWL